MSSERSRWDIYHKEMCQLVLGHALWEPGPHSYFKRVQLGDVGYIRRGSFHLLFSAGCPLGEREPGVHVPRGFEELRVEQIINPESQGPGYITTPSVRATRATPASRTPTSSTSTVPALESGRSFSFRLFGGQGAALVTKYQILREDIQHMGTIEKYIKKHYTSWVKFASTIGHGDKINPILVTGIDRTRDFAMMCYSNDDDDLGSEFITSVSGGSSASAWGTWRTTGFVHTNCGPQLRLSPSSSQTMDSTASDNNHAELVSDDYNQCVFLRYSTMRKWLGIPRVIKASAGPHGLDPGSREDGYSPGVEARSPSDSGSDFMSSLCDDDGSNNGSVVTSIESESDVVIHTIPDDEKDDFDAIADYVFQNSDADSVLIHHRDIALLREPGDSTDLSVQVLEKRPQITVDDNGVGTIGSLTDPSADIWSDGITSPTPSFIPGEIQYGAMNRMSLSGSRSFSPSGYPPHRPPGGTQEATSDASGTILESSALPYDDPMLDRFHIEDQSSTLYDATLRRLYNNVALLAPAHDETLPSSINGICIPQNKYEKGTGRGAPAHQNLVPFVREDGSFIPVSAAFAGDYSGLVDRDLPELLGAGSTITLRFEWPGYTPQDAQLQTYERRRSLQRITLAKLATQVCKIIKQVVERMETQEIAPEHQKWRVGPNGIQWKDLRLAALEQVSAGSYQPRLFWKP